MSDAKDTFKYHLKVGKKTVHRGICYDLEQREVAHQREFPGSRIVQVGRRTTRDAALKWEGKGGHRAYRAPYVSGRTVNRGAVRVFLRNLVVVVVWCAAGWWLSRLWVPAGRVGLFDAVMGAILILAVVMFLWGVGFFAREKFNHLFPKKER